MIVQDFFKDVNAGSENRSKVSVKNCRKIIKGTCDESLKVFAVGRIIHTLNSM